MKQAVILAGGRGTRLATVLAGKPKPLVDICGKPLLGRQLELLRLFGFERILLLVSYGAQQIVDYCRREQHCGLRIDFVVDEEALGTAGAVLAAMDRLEEQFVVMYGDTMLDVDLRRFCAFHGSRSTAAATLLVHPNDHPHDSDLVEIDTQDRVTAFLPKPRAYSHAARNLVNAALYAVRRAALLPHVNASRPCDFAHDLFPAMLARGQVLLAYNSPEYIKDCGTPQRLEAVRADCESGRIARRRLDNPQRAVFLDRDGTINREVGHLANPAHVELEPGVGAAIARLNASDYRTVIVTNQPVLARGACSYATLDRIHGTIDELLASEHAYVDRVYFCPHHPDSGFEGEIPELKVECQCRKPKPGMINLAVSELNIAVSESWLIGDSSVDVATAVAAGLKSVLLETGHAGLDRRCPVMPQFIFPDMGRAVDFILEGFERSCAVAAPHLAGVRPGDFIFIGGLARGGKTNFAYCVRESLRRSGMRAVVLSLDRWLRPPELRRPQVVGRYDVGSIERLLRQLCERTASLRLNLPVYDRITRSPLPLHEHIDVAPDDVLIVEGTIALMMVDGVSQDRRHAFFVEANESERRLRLLREYRVRGIGIEEAEALYQQRQSDEAPLVVASAAAAAHVICVPAEGSSAPERAGS